MKCFREKKLINILISKILIYMKKNKKFLKLYNVVKIILNNIKKIQIMMMINWNNLLMNMN